MSFVQQAKELLHALESEVKSTLFSDFCSATVFAILFNLKPLLCRRTWGQESNVKFGHVLISREVLWSPTLTLLDTLSYW